MPATGSQYLNCCAIADRCCCPMQGLIDVLETVNSVANGTVQKLDRVYEAVLACVGLTAVVTLMFLVLAGGGTLLLAVWSIGLCCSNNFAAAQSYEQHHIACYKQEFGSGAVLNNRKLMHGCLVLLPVTSLLLWCTGALLYGVLLNGTDLCNGLSVFLLNPAQQQRSQIRVDLFPCPSADVSLAMKLSTTQALFNLTRAANTIIEGEGHTRVGLHWMWADLRSK